MKDAIDRVIGVIDENGVIVACSELQKIGEQKRDVREELSYMGEALLLDGVTYRPIGNSTRIENIVFVEGEDKLADRLSSVLAISLANGNWEMVLRYFIPIIFFVVGVSVAMWISQNTPQSGLLCWQHYTILLEIALLFIVSWIPYGKVSNICANVLVSFTCAIQAESFRKVLGTPFASTMCTGNLRNATEYLNHFFVDKEKSLLQKSIQYFGIDLLFVLGAVVGTFTTKNLKTYATLCCCIVLCTVFFSIPRNRKTAN